MNKALNKIATDPDSVYALIQDLEFDGQLEEIAKDGRIGIVALATDYNLEQDIRRMLPLSVEVFTNRVLNANPMTLENLKAMAPDIERAAQGILPGHGVNVMIYGCTSGTAAIGYDNVQRLIHKSNPGIPVITPLTATFAALDALEVKSISVLTPYDRVINEALMESIIESGMKVNNFSGLGFDSDIDVTKVPLKTIRDMAVEIFDSRADALFISCTAFRASMVIDEIEQAIGKPVVSSNQALAWHSLKMLGYKGQVQGYGKLFETLS
ncbi:MAG: Asp/Glu racemase [Gammaproteobacteria bacterium]|nr:Asp/Glu racemase [Gammaproteobacteria bacterium]NKB65416.1 Asp/Glu racemase [Gammaproteobacteria bacterium]